MVIIKDIEKLQSNQLLGEKVAKREILKSYQGEGDKTNVLMGRQVAY